MKSLSCPNRQCPLARKASSGNIIGHGFYRTNRGRRRRYRCSTCGKTFCSNTGTPYHRLQHRRAACDEVAALSVEGLNKSAIARVKRISWNTVHRWLQRAAGSCRRFNDRKTTGYAITEVQADEIRTIIRRKEQPIWIFATIEVWSRLWPATIVGRRSYRNTLTLFRDISSRMNLERVPLITTDGFTFYAKVIRRVFGPACLYGQVIKTRRNDRIVKVERRAVIGADWRLEKILADSEDSSKLNTSSIERLHLTIRQGSAYLLERTIIQLPLGWYAEKGGYWGMNSGYDRPDHYGFRRPITYDCMFCHNAYPPVLAGHEQQFAQSVYEGPLPEGIDCQRCHGPGSRHVQLAATAGAKRQDIRSAIVNPSRLSAERQMEI